MKRIVVGLILGFMFFVSNAQAVSQQIAPIELSFLDFIYHPIDVAGIRLGVPYGRNDSVTGIDLGLWGKSIYMYGFQFNLLASHVEDRAGAIQISCYNNTRGLVGMQAGLWNNGDMVTGVQFGFLNLADQVEGFQVGLINRAELMHGFQIGLVNVIRSATLPFCPIVNVGF